MALKRYQERVQFHMPGQYQQTDEQVKAWLVASRPVDHLSREQLHTIVDLDDETFRFQVLDEGEYEDRDWRDDLKKFLEDPAVYTPE